MTMGLLGACVTWSEDDGSGSQNDIMFSCVSRYGAVTRSPIRVNVVRPGDQMSPVGATGFFDGVGAVGIIVWQSVHLDQVGTKGIAFRRFDSGMSFIESNDTTVNSQVVGDQTQPAVCMLETGFMIVWKDSNDGDQSGIRGRFINANGSFNGTDTIINLRNAGAQGKPMVAALQTPNTNAGKLESVWFVVSWQNDAAPYIAFRRGRAGENGVFWPAGQTSFSNGNVVEVPTVVSGPGNYFMLAFHDNLADGATGGCYAAYFSPDGAMISNQMIRLHPSLGGDQDSCLVYRHQNGHDFSSVFRDVSPNLYFVSKTRLNITSQLDVQLPSITQQTSITITVQGTSGGDLTFANAFMSGVMADIESVVPSYALPTGGSTHTITGQELGSGSDVTSVTISGISAGIVSQTTSRVIMTAPPHPIGVYDVTIVSTSRGTISKAGSFAYTNVFVSSVFPLWSSMNGGTRITIVGNGLNNLAANVSDLGGNSFVAAFFSSSNSQAVISTPSVPSPSDITLFPILTLSDGVSIILYNYGITFIAAPTMSSYHPDSSRWDGGVRVTIIGTGLSPVAVVTSNGAVGTVVSQSSSQIVFLSGQNPMPSNTAFVNITLISIYGDVVYSPFFRYRAVPSISVVAPTSTDFFTSRTVTISGPFLGNGTDITSVVIANTSASILSQTNTSVTVVTGAPQVFTGNLTGGVMVQSVFWGKAILESNIFTYICPAESQKISFVNVSGLSVVNTRRQVPLAFDVAVTRSVCNVNNALLFYQWTQLAGPAVTGLVSTTQRTFNLLANQLTAGQTYVFSGSVSTTLGGPAIGGSNVTINVLQQPFVLSVVGGDASRPSSLPLQLSAQITDPDGANVNNAVFTWSCTNSTAICTHPNVTAETSGTVMLDTLDIALVRFNVSATLTGRSANALANIDFVPGNPPAISAITTTPHANPSDKLILSIQSNQVCSPVWSMVSGVLDLTSTSVVGSSSTSSNLVILPNNLAAGQTYVFQALCSNVNGTGRSKVTVVSNSPPTGGTCTTASSAIGGESMVLSCSGWTDADAPLLYYFGRVDSVGNVQALSQPSTSPSATIIASPGPLPSRLVTYSAFIVDGYGATTSVTFTSTITVPDLAAYASVASYASTVADNSLQVALTAGDTTQATQIVQYAAWLLNNADNTVNDVSSRRTIRATFVNSMETIISSTTVQSKQGVEQNLKTLGDMSQSAAEVSDSAQQKGLDIVKTLITSTQSVGLLSSTGNIIATTIGNLVAARSTSAETSASAGTIRNSTADGIASDSVRAALKLLAQSQVAALACGERPAVATSTHLVSSTALTDPLMIAGSGLAPSQNSSFTLPASLFATANVTGGGACLSTQTIAYNANPYAYATAGSSNISTLTAVTSLTIRSGDGSSDVSIQNLASPVSLSFPRAINRTLTSNETIVCQWWDANIQAWSSVGCVTTFNNVTFEVTCNCTHLTDFVAFLLQILPEFHFVNVFDLSGLTLTWANSATLIFVCALALLYIVLFVTFSCLDHRNMKICVAALEERQAALSSDKGNWMDRHESNENLQADDMQAPHDQPLGYDIEMKPSSTAVIAAAARTSDSDHEQHSEHYDSAEMRGARPLLQSVESDASMSAAAAPEFSSLHDPSVNTAYEATVQDPAPVRLEAQLSQYDLAVDSPQAKYAEPTDQLKLMQPAWSPQESGHMMRDEQQQQQTAQQAQPDDKWQRLRMLKYHFLTGLKQEHAWFSTAVTPLDEFTRPQRVTVLSIAIMSGLFVSTIFFGNAVTNAGQWFLTGVFSALLMLPPTLLFAFLFKKCRSGISSREAILLKELAKQEGLTAAEMRRMKGLGRCARCNTWKFPSWVLPIVYILSWGSMVLLGYYIVVFGLRFQNETSVDWLKAAAIGNTQDIVLMEPLKVLLIALQVTFLARCGVCAGCVDGMVSVLGSAG
eukprot:TRINITY_DN6972_c0_g1_i3.p1 TRINITY_DN6972_c0_g1~~TRINITY_DN6972_c0_g1_i3.p1  ORF type:complete len:1924 (+),score=494.39 TRINITY_DN6972_c0_g1_i3:898-6669(+)